MSLGDDVSEVASLVAHFRSALDKARTLKKGPSVEPPLSASDFRNDVSRISNPDAADAQPPTSSQHMAVETAARSILFERLACSTIDDPDFVEVWNLLDLVQFCADCGQCEPGLTLWLIEELLDSQTIQGCRGVFDYLESRCERLVGNELTQNKRNTILRTCNELLHRLSRAEDAVFCGRVFIFLFKIFPLGDKSAVNLRGEFHVENTTSFDDSTAQDVGNDSMDVDTGPAAPSDGNKDDDNHGKEEVGPIKTAAKNAEPTSKSEEEKTSNGQDAELGLDRLYARFWSLQHVFSNPPRIFNDAEFEKFKSGLEVTLKKFKSVTKVSTAHGDHTRGTKRKLNAEGADLASSFNPKYLTSKDLFELEMSDITFQRHILVQALILIDFVLSLTPAAKKKNEDLKAQKAMVYAYTLSEDNTKWANSMRSQIGQYLRGDVEGHLYHRMVDTVLSRDKNWVRWKIESCPSIQRPAVTAEEYTQARESAKRACATKRLKARPMGSIDLGFLTDERSSGNLESLKRPERFEAPELERLVGETQEAELNLEMLDKDKDAAEWTEAVSKRASKAWRTLRLASKTRLARFAEIDELSGIDNLTKEAQDSTEEAARPTEATDATLVERGDQAEQEGRVVQGDVNTGGKSVDTVKPGGAGQADTGAVPAEAA